jgi:hypothetical protein
MIILYNRKALVVALERVRKAVCQYSGSKCDCKYGASISGEETGCPELRDVIDFLNTMTETEYKKVWKRAEKQRMKEWVE